MRIRLNPDYKYREIAGMYYLIPCGEVAERSRMPIQLTETAAWIWKRLESGDSPEEMAAGMTDAFETDRESAEKGVRGFVDLLLEQGMACVSEKDMK